MLIQLIYCSTAKKLFGREELDDLLTVARLYNSQFGITGILLYLEGNFFQVLEGEEDHIDALYKKIKNDKRHHQVVLIIRESIPRRTFKEWTMGFTTISAKEIDEIIGDDDFSQGKISFFSFGESRAKKLIDAFGKGYWRSRISGPMVGTESHSIDADKRLLVHEYAPAKFKRRPDLNKYSYAFQPIIDISSERIYSYEALLRGKNNEPPMYVIENIHSNNVELVDTQGLVKAIYLAGYLGLSTNINLNISPSSIVNNASLVSNILTAIEKCKMQPQQIILEILENELVESSDTFAKIINNYRSAGIMFAIDDFGAGFAGLNLLSEFQPQLIKLDMQIIREVDQNGPRQAIIRGIKRTCTELGIEIVAEGVETENEYQWLKNEGILLLQGYLFAKPAFEKMPKLFNLPG